MQNIWIFFLKQTRFSILLIASLFIFGLLSLSAIPKESTPQVEVPIFIVNTGFPGASAADVETLVTNTLEKRLRNNLEDVKKVTSTSQNNFSSIIIEFLARADLDKAGQDVRDEVDIAKIDLPDDANDPNIKQVDLTDDPILFVSLSSQLPQNALFKIAEDTRDELEKVQGISSVVLGGYRKKEVQIIVKRTALERYGLDLQAVSNAIGSGNITLPSGVLQVNGAEIPVQFNGDIKDPSELQNIIIPTKGGGVVYLRDIAKVIDGRTKEKTRARTSVEGGISAPSLTMYIFKSNGVNITDASRIAKSKLKDMQKSAGLLENVDVLVMFDNGEQLLKDLTTLVYSGIETTLLVMITLAIAIGWREALLAGLAIPLSFLIAFIALNYTGNSINFVSLFALVLAVGIIVDSAIVIIEGINIRLKGGDSNIKKDDASISALAEFNIPLIAGTMTTVAVFAPLFLVSGIVGQFIKSIPFTLIFVLFASLFVALGIVPLAAAHFLKRSHTQTKFAKKRREVITTMESKYKAFLLRFLKTEKETNKLILTLVVMFIISLALPVTGAVKTIFFASDDSDYVFINIELAHGSILNEADIETRKIEEKIHDIPEIDSYVITSGELSQFTRDESFTGGAHYANFFIILKEDRGRSNQEISEYLRNLFKDIHTSSISIKQLENGPPSAYPIAITYLGDDFNALDTAADKTAKVLSTIQGTTDVQSSTRNNGNAFMLTVDRARAMSYGVSVMQIAQTLRTALYGSTATVIKGADEDIDVIVKLGLNTESNPHDSNKISIEALQQTKIMTSRGALPLSLFTKPALESDRAVILHEDGLRIAKVTANITANGNVLDIMNAFKGKYKDMNIEGVKMKSGGEDEDTKKSFQDMFMALVFGMISMFAILVLQFNSFRYAGYVLLAVPLSLIGVLGGFLLVGIPISFPGIIGFIALAGIVVNNAIILIDTINNERRKNGGDVLNAVIDGASSRLRPVLLTAITTVIGIAPLIFAAAMWAPLAYSIMFGLAFSTLITLILVPMVYYRWPGKNI